MLEKFIFGVYFLLMLGGVMITSMLIALVIQAIIYRTTKISIYKVIMNKLFN